MHCEDEHVRICSWELANNFAVQAYLARQTHCQSLQVQFRRGLPYNLHDERLSLLLTRTLRRSSRMCSCWSSTLCPGSSAIHGIYITIHYPIRNAHVMHDQYADTMLLILNREWTWNGCVIPWNRAFRTPKKACSISFLAASCHAVIDLSLLVTGRSIPLTNLGDCGG